MKLHTIDTGYFKLDGGAMFGVVPKSIWSQKIMPDENNMCTWAMRCLLIEDGDKLILIDTGIGDKQDLKFFSHYHLHGNDSLMKSIQSKGFSANDITDVILTHLHFDHVGGAVRIEKEVPILTFPNATYWSNSDQWNWAINPNAREKASFLPENIQPIQDSGRLRFVASDGDKAVFNDQIDLIMVNGHTEKMMLPLIQYGEQSILYCADLIPSIHHIPLPWIMGYDMRPLDTLDEKTKILTLAAQNNWILYYEHDANHVASLVTQTPKGFVHGDIIQIEW